MYVIIKSKEGAPVCAWGKGGKERKKLERGERGRG